jgi:5S rRNA maturation endonuclease (ribonuclease M5)
MGYYDAAYEYECTRSKAVDNAALYEKWLIILLTEFDKKGGGLNKDISHWWTEKKKEISEREAYRLAEEKLKKKKAVAISKLTPEEREILGLVRYDAKIGR